MQIVFTTEDFLEIPIKNWSQWNLNPRPLNELSGHDMYMHIYIYTTNYIDR